SGWTTTASGSRPPTPSGCSSSSSACMPRSGIPGRVSAWLCARRSSSSTEAASGSIRPFLSGRPCAGRCRFATKEKNRVSDDALAAVPAPVGILLVEDDPGDVLMTKEALADAKMANELHVVSNGEEALAFLFQE